MKEKLFVTYLDFFIDKLTSDRAPQNTLKGYTWAARKLRKDFLNYDADKIGRCEVDMLKKNYIHLAAASVNLLLVTLKKTLSLAQEYGAVATVPTMEFLTPAVSQDFLTEEEAQRLLDFSHHPLRLMVAIALTTGLRRENIFNLKWTEIQDGAVTVRAKRGKMISIPLSPRVMDMLERHGKYQVRKKGRLSEWVFPSVRNFDSPKSDKMDGGLNLVYKKASLPHSGWHVLRHTFATSFLRETNNIRLLQDILGHSDISQTARYAHIAMDQKREALDQHSQGLTISTKPIPRCRRKKRVD